MLGAVLIIKIPVMNAFAVTQPDLIESLSIPTQQISAVLCNDRYLAPEELELIENVIDLTYIKELYNPYFADNMKELVRAGDHFASPWPSISGGLSYCLYPSDLWILVP